METAHLAPPLQATINDRSEEWGLATGHLDLPRNSLKPATWPVIHSRSSSRPADKKTVMAFYGVNICCEDMGTLYKDDLGKPSNKK